MVTGPSIQTLTPVPGLACTPQVCPCRPGQGRTGLGAGPGGGPGMGLTPGHSPAGSLSSRFSEPSMDQSPGASIPSALVLISVV